MTNEIYKVCPSQKELNAKDGALEQPTVDRSLTVQKPLSGEEIDKITMTSLVGSFNCRIFARAIEKHHGIHQ